MRLNSLLAHELLCLRLRSFYDLRTGSQSAKVSPTRPRPK
jgi:hypothetical protein